MGSTESEETAEQPIAEEQDSGKRRRGFRRKKPVTAKVQ